MMKKVTLGKSGQQMPAVVVGCMRLGEKDKASMNHFIHAAVEQGAYYFDHADIYAGGMSEEIFGEAWSDDPSLRREEMFLPDYLMHALDSAYHDGRRLTAPVATLYKAPERKDGLPWWLTPGCVFLAGAALLACLLWRFRSGRLMRAVAFPFFLASLFVIGSSTSCGPTRSIWWPLSACASASPASSGAICASTYGYWAQDSCAGSCSRLRWCIPRWPLSPGWPTSPTACAPSPTNGHPLTGEESK